MHSVTVKTAPAEEPVTLAEAKAWMRVSLSDDDDLITELITAARILAELFTNRFFVTQTVEYRLDCFPYSFRILQTPIQSVTSIKYIDTDGVEQTLASNKYTLDNKSRGARIEPAYGECWPSTRHVLNTVTVEYVAGYGGASAMA